ncbi:PREDICTED: cystatin-9-like [Chinchilla lanigera]|uniref:cystatin-9-like n=1 Tax=Chinchilla lanigera TaxID=34839 RepID=UPI0006965FD7|nr:PREDICTED: cystatin-9-like [Chinchilla lanigera]
MRCPPGWWALPWATLLLLLCIQPWVTHAWCSEENLGYQQQVSNPELRAAVQLALDTFNQQSWNENAYRLERLLSFQPELDKSPGRVLSMQLLLRRTVCRKSERGIDICPFHSSPEPSNTFTCSFTIRSQHHGAQLSILKKMCSPGPPSQ